MAKLGERLRKIFEWNSFIPDKYEFNLGPITITSTSCEPLGLLGNVGLNLKHAEKNGIKPLSYREIAEQLPEGLENAVLFDTPKSPGLVGNHWRVVSQAEETVTLQMCGIFGNHDEPDIFPVEVAKNLPLFTGLSLQKYELDGRPATLAQTTQTNHQARENGLDHPIGLKYLGEEILFSDGQGLLTPLDLGLPKVPEEGLPEYLDGLA